MISVFTFRRNKSDFINTFSFNSQIWFTSIYICNILQHTIKYSFAVTSFERNKTFIKNNDDIYLILARKLEYFTNLLFTTFNKANKFSLDTSILRCFTVYRYSFMIRYGFCTWKPVVLLTPLPTPQPW